MNGTINTYGNNENILAVVENSFSDTTVKIELTEKSATVLGFGRNVVGATIPKSALFDIADKAVDTGTRILFVTR